MQNNVSGTRQQSPTHAVSIILTSYTGGQGILSSKLSSDIVCRVGSTHEQPIPGHLLRLPSRLGKKKYTATGTSVSEGYVRVRTDGGLVIHGQGSYTDSNRLDTTPVVSYEVNYDEREV